MSLLKTILNQAFRRVDGQAAGAHGLVQVLQHALAAADEDRAIILLAEGLAEHPAAKPLQELAAEAVARLQLTSEMAQCRSVAAQHQAVSAAEAQDASARCSALLPQVMAQRSKIDRLKQLGQDLIESEHSASAAHAEAERGAALDHARARADGDEVLVRRTELKLKAAQAAAMEANQKAAALGAQRAAAVQVLAEEESKLQTLVAQLQAVNLTRTQAQLTEAQAAWDAGIDGLLLSVVELQTRAAQAGAYMAEFDSFALPVFHRGRVAAEHLHSHDRPCVSDRHLAQLRKLMRPETAPAAVLDQARELLAQLLAGVAQQG